MANVKITCHDPNGLLSNLPQLGPNIEAAIRYLNQYVVFKGTVDVEVDVDNGKASFDGPATAALLGQPVEVRLDGLQGAFHLGNGPPLAGGKQLQRLIFQTGQAPRARPVGTGHDGRRGLVAQAEHPG